MSRILQRTLKIELKENFVFFVIMYGRSDPG